MTILDYIINAEKILIIGHIRPDGDCLGSGFAVMHICEKYNKSVDFLSDSEKPQHYAFLSDFPKLNDQKFRDYDLLITVDCADQFRLGKYAGYLKIPNSINIDHHKTNTKFAKVNIVERDASSTCEILYKILKENGEIDDKIAYLLFVGLSTDTGHFMHSNTTPETFTIAANLASYKSVDTNAITNLLYKHNTREKTKLIARAINSMRFFAEDKICLITIFMQDLIDCNCTLSDTEGLIDYGMSIDTVDAAVCMTEQSGMRFKVSYRSKTVDVAAAAATFGGGGHTRAAGCEVGGMVEEVVAKIVKSITDGME